jgi:hypothetical protein
MVGYLGLYLSESPLLFRPRIAHEGLRALSHLLSPAHRRRRTGDVKKLKPPFTNFRLRGGDYRIFRSEGTITQVATHAVASERLARSLLLIYRIGINGTVHHPN